MSVDPVSMAKIAAAVAHPSRAAMCLALLDGRSWTPTELARVAGTAKSTASEHLAALVASGLLVQERQGRHRYLRLASSDAAKLIESLGAFSGRLAAVDSLRAVSVRDAMAQARTCYDHVAGALGVAIFDSLVGRGAIVLEPCLALTSSGADLVTGLAGAPSLHPATRRPLLRTCLDWTERRHHLGGHMANVLRQSFLDREWLTPQGASRALRVTAAGSEAMQSTFDLQPSPWRWTDPDGPPTSPS